MTWSSPAAPRLFHVEQPHMEPALRAGLPLGVDVDVGVDVG